MDLNWQEEAINEKNEAKKING
uniref:Uncharacterized protein n=1 Tax=Tetranychus urticae TaxID=32264 RepID=T1KEC3_TETUR